MQKRVKKIVFTKEDLERLLKKGLEEKERIDKITPLKDDSIFMCHNARMVTNEFIAKWRELPDTYVSRLHTHKQAD